MADTDRSREIDEALDRARDLMVEDGMDEGTANALIFAARPPRINVSGNLADLNRMGMIGVKGEMVTPEGEENVQTSDLQEAFVEPPPMPTDAELAAQAGTRPEENAGEEPGAVEDPGSTSPEEGGGGGGAEQSAVSDSMTKAELQAEAARRNVTVDESMTKAQMIDAINNA